MSVSNIMNNGLSALLANQSALRTTSTNIANVNTEGYVRQDTQMTAVSLGGRGAGVQAVIERAADRFLAATHMTSISSASYYDTSAGLMDRAQASLGDPSGSTSIFAGMDAIIAKASALTSDPTSSLRRNDLVSVMEAAFEDIQTGFATIDSLREEANSRLNGAMESANLLMGNIATLNAEIQKLKISGSDANALENEQGQLMNELAEIIDFKIIEKSMGGVELRTTTGMLLVDLEAAKLSFSESDTGARYEGISITPPGADSMVDITRQIQGGEIRGLLNARDKDLPELSYALGELSGSLASALNIAANEGTAYPPPNTLEGRNTGLVATDSLNFTGAAVFAVVDQTGRTVDTVSVDFDAGTAINSNGAVNPIGGTIGSFVTALNSSFGADATVTFSNGTLSMAASGTNGLAIAQDPDAPSDRAGRGVSAFFGLNDVITSFAPPHYDTGLRATDAHGFDSGSITFGVRDENGDLVEAIDFTPTAGTSMADLVTELNGNGVLGYYATASLDANGRLLLTPKTGTGTSVIDVLSDNTQRGTTATSMSSMFGLGIEGPSERARSLQVDSQLSLTPALLPSAGFDINATTPGDLGVAPGDNTGTLAFQNALSQTVTYHDISGTPLSSMVISDLAAEVASDAGSRAAYLEGRASAAVALQDEAQLRRSSVEGVNLDEEMVKMTTYQQSYAAASRLITAARDMYDTLLNMV